MPKGDRSYGTRKDAGLSIPVPTRLTKTNPKPEASVIAAVATDHAVENIGKQRRDPNRSPSQAVGI